MYSLSSLYQRISGYKVIKSGISGYDYAILVLNNHAIHHLSYTEGLTKIGCYYNWKVPSDIKKRYAQRIIKWLRYRPIQYSQTAFDIGSINPTGFAHTGNILNTLYSYIIVRVYGLITRTKPSLFYMLNNAGNQITKLFSYRHKYTFTSDPRRLMLLYLSYQIRCFKSFNLHYRVIISQQDLLKAQHFKVCKALSIPEYIPHTLKIDKYNFNLCNSNGYTYIFNDMCYSHYLKSKRYISCNLYVSLDHKYYQEQWNVLNTYLSSLKFTPLNVILLPLYAINNNKLSKRQQVGTRYTLKDIREIVYNIDRKKELINLSDLKRLRLPRVLHLISLTDNIGTIDQFFIKLHTCFKYSNLNVLSAIFESGGCGYLLHHWFFRFIYTQTLK